MALKSATSRMTASLNAFKALNDRNFAKTVRNIAAAKEEAKARVHAARSEFKTKINLHRAPATHMLAKETGKLYAAIAKGEKEQMKINGKLATQTRNARLDIADELRSAKDDFSKRMAALHTNIVSNDKKFEGKMDKLAGIVRANAVKNARGRAQLSAIMKANKMELKAAVQSAVHKGEVRMMKAEMKLKDMNKKTKASLNMRITSEVSKLAKES